MGEHFNEKNLFTLSLLFFKFSTNSYLHFTLVRTLYLFLIRLSLSLTLLELWCVVSIASEFFRIFNTISKRLLLLQFHFHASPWWNVAFVFTKEKEMIKIISKHLCACSSTPSQHTYDMLGTLFTSIFCLHVSCHWLLISRLCDAFSFPRIFRDFSFHPFCSYISFLHSLLFVIVAHMCNFVWRIFAHFTFSSSFDSFIMRIFIVNALRIYWSRSYFRVCP